MRIASLRMIKGQDGVIRSASLGIVRGHGILLADSLIRGIADIARCRL